MFLWWCWAGSSRCAGQRGMGDPDENITTCEPQHWHLWRISQSNQPVASSRCNDWKITVSLFSWQAWVSVLWLHMHVCLSEEVEREQIRTRRRFAAWHGCCMCSGVSKSRLSERRRIMWIWWIPYGWYSQSHILYGHWIKSWVVPNLLSHQKTQCHTVINFLGLVFFILHNI